MPKVNYSESWTRSDNPVFVFSSLLTQHQFGEQNFQIGPLNRPDFLNNFQSQVTADQTLYDAGQTKHAVRSAELTKGHDRRGRPAHANGSDRRRDPVLLRRAVERGAIQCDQPGHAFGAGGPRARRSGPVRGNVHRCRCALDPRSPGRRSRATDPPRSRSGRGPRRAERCAGPAARHAAHSDHGAGAFETAGGPAWRTTKRTRSARGRRRAR